MPIPTITESMAKAQSCFEKTTLATALTAVVTGLEGANARGRMGNHAAAQLRDKVCDLAAEIADNLKSI